MLDRLMSRAVFAQSDAVMREDIDDLLFHQRRQPNRRAHVIRENEECSAIRNKAAMQRDAVHDCAHAMLADAEAEIPPAEISRLNVAIPFQIGVIRGRKVCRAADQRGNHFGNGIQDLS